MIPGCEVKIVDSQLREVRRGETGELMLKTDSMASGYWNKHERTKETFIGEWQRTGDQFYQDEEGYFWYQGRADDIIKTSGYRVGPFDVESVLVEHPAIAEAAAIGKPDPEGVRGEIIKAFAVLRPGHKPSEKLKEEIKSWCKERLARYAYPREIEFKDNLPKTRSGKIMRRVLKAM